MLVAAADNPPPLSQMSSSRILHSREQQRKVIVCWICMWMNKKTPAYQPGTHSQKAACLISVNRQARALTSVRAAQCRPRRKCPLSNLLRKERQALFSTNGRSVLAFPYAPTRWPASYLFSLTLFVPLSVDPAQVQVMYMTPPPVRMVPTPPPIPAMPVVGHLGHPYAMDRNSWHSHT